MILPWILGFSILGAAIAISAAAVMLLLPDNIRRAIIPDLVSLAAGSLLGAAFLGILPATLSQAPADTVMPTVLGGIVLFFLLEKFALWRHQHTGDHWKHGQAAAPLILIGDAFHNFVDGMVIATAFLTSIPLGIAATFAVIMHEVPQEISDFIILLDGGYGRMKALILNSLSAAAIIPGAMFAYFWLVETQKAIPYILALSAASFIYIAIADLIPNLNREFALRSSLRQLALLLAGIASIALLNFSH